MTNFVSVVANLTLISLTVCFIFPRKKVQYPLEAE